MSKAYALDGSEIKPLATGHGSCIASDRITVDGRPVGFMYRERTDSDLDSGWRFMAGDESDEYLANPDNFGLHDVNTVANYDPAIVPLLTAPIGNAYMRDEAGRLATVNH
ncbi:MAG TPA: DUF2185 domain-containing protein [Rhizomicrobium sp.]|nr:DUF2185 domain-containing protein [Rhizomicrobium sp.]